MTILLCSLVMALSVSTRLLFLAGTASVGFFEALVNEHEDDLEPLFSPLLKQLFETVCQLSLHRPSDVSSCFGVLDFITRHSSLACVFTKSEYWLPRAVPMLQMPGTASHQSPVHGTAYEDATLLGRLAGLTCISRPLRKSVSCMSLYWLYLLAVLFYAVLGFLP